MTRSRAAALARATVTVAVVVAAVAALASEWDRVSGRLGDASTAGLVLSGGCVAAALWCSMLAWRALLAELGSPLALRTAAGVFFPAQLGKYLPGGVWPAVAQAELAARHAVPRRQSGAATGALLVLTPLTGALVAAAVLPFASPDLARRYWPVALVVPVGALLLHPAVFGRLVDRALRFVRRPPLDRPLSGRALARALGWLIGAWLLYGGHTLVLARDIGATAPGAAYLSLGAFALAWTVGFLVIVVPAGAGVRDVALALALTPAFTGTPAERTAAAAGVALLSRLVLTAADVSCAAGAALAAGRGVRPGPSPAPIEDSTNSARRR